MPDPSGPNFGREPREEKPAGGLPQSEQREDAVDQRPEPQEIKAEITKEEREATKKQLVTAINEVLKPAGFKRKGAVWRREINDIFQVVYLQRSYLGFEFFLEIGIFEPAKKPGVSTPEITDCQYRKRVETRERENLLDFKNDDILASERIALIAERLTSEVLPFFEANNSSEARSLQVERDREARLEELKEEERQETQELRRKIQSGEIEPEEKITEEEKVERARLMANDMFATTKNPLLDVKRELAMAMFVKMIIPEYDKREWTLPVSIFTEGSDVRMRVRNEVAKRAAGEIDSMQDQQG